ncbi:protein TESPA1 isoform X2 [Dunckerocampus dactyliophorus]|uniref:protein TESPA1 isoform X2 n=1 Tax=Dunckerocampus dactyliophorus TaxID=161453 RepID=UPI002405C8CC|nr:protein TESPA1 isoform X2 [Dunckerocampus dactyliophorus]
MDSRSSTGSRQWLTLEEMDPGLPPCSTTSVADDDVFADGCFTGKLEYLLQKCGLEACSDNRSLCRLALNGGDEKGRAMHSATIERHSIVSPHKLPSLCSSACNTAPSVPEVLQLRWGDAEDTLYEMGFGCDEPHLTVRIPPRFLTFPSQARGINFRLFLDSQLRRIREEDPSLCIASTYRLCYSSASTSEAGKSPGQLCPHHPVSLFCINGRFRQVQALTAMANAFYSLYSHVSRTPLRKLAAPEFTFTSTVERMERFRSSVHSEPRSPADRLKDTVSKMCLYTGSPRGSDSTSPLPSPRRSSLPVDLFPDPIQTEANKRLELVNTRRDTGVLSPQSKSVVETHQSGVL